MNSKLPLGIFMLSIILSTIVGCKSNPASDSSAVVASDSTIVATDTTALKDTTQQATSPVPDSTIAGTPLTVIVTNLASDTGPIVIGLYGEKNKFPDPNDQMKVYTFKPHGKTYAAKINGLEFNTYALAIYQDVNSNGKIDKNLIGIPTEPYAFSKNYKPTVKAPAFKDCKFEYTAKNDTVNIKMIR